MGLIAPPEIAIECGAFTGTLGTLVRCVMQQKIDLWEIPLYPVCQAYLAYLTEASPDDWDGSSTALLAMSYLVERKAFRLLPLPEPEPEEWDDAVYEGPEILDFREVLLALEERFESRQNLFFRTSDPRGEYEIPFDLGRVTVDDLGRALQSLLNRATESPEFLVSKPRRSLAEQMEVVERRLSPEPQDLLALMEGEFTKEEAMWWFLALLELIRLGKGQAVCQEDGVVRFWRPEVAA